MYKTKLLCAELRLIFPNQNMWAVVLIIGITEALTKQGIYVYYYAAEDDDAPIKERLQKIKKETDGKLLIQTRYGKDVPHPPSFWNTLKKWFIGSQWLKSLSLIPLGLQ